jgi:nucleotide-binding universal stress UspA family protein
MFSRIMVVTDLSQDSAELIRCASGLRALGSRDAHLVFCAHLHEIGHIKEHVESILKPAMEEQRAKLAESGLAVTTDVALGPPETEINRLANEWNCSMIVVGARIHTLAGDIISSSAASAAVYHARKPVLELRLYHGGGEESAACRNWPCQPLNHILYPTDFSENAAHAFTYLEQLAPGAKRVTLVHVQDRTRLVPYLEHRIEEFNKVDTDRLQRLRDRLQTKAPSVQVDIELPFGHPTEEILARTRAADVSLVIMGTQGRGAISELFLGSVSHNIARHAPVPILLVPQTQA